jgi:cell division protein FtsW (lipid II flippase)
MEALTRQTHPGGSFPITLVLLAAAIAILGWLGIERGDELSQAGSFHGKQGVWLILAGCALWVGSQTPFDWLRRGAWTAFGVGIVLLVLVYFFPARWGSRRWIPLGVLYFQPSELAKIAFIITLARYLESRETHRRLGGLVVPFGITLPERT